MPWWVWAILGILVLFVLPTMVCSWFIFRGVLMRPKGEKRERKCNFPDEKEYVAMYTAAEAWRAQVQDKKRDVTVTNDGLKLYGEYYDFGFDRAAIMLPGRTETCVYSSYFAEPYRQLGWNILVIDGRAHGLSDGRLNCLGYREYRDVLKWIGLLESFGNKKIWIHGLCIGSFTALRCCTAKQRPASLAGMTGEGMYRNFYITTLNHMKDQHRPIFPFIYGLMAWIHLCCGGSAMFDGPFRRMPKMQLPILMLHSREDLFSAPALAQNMYDSCPSGHKRLVWFDKGGHSRIRVNNPETYDEAIRTFMTDLERGAV